MKKFIKASLVAATLCGSALFASEINPTAVAVDTLKVEDVKKAYVANELTAAEIQELKERFPALLNQGQIEITRSKKYDKVTQFEVEIQSPQGPIRFSSFAVDGVDYIFSGNAYDKDAKVLTLPVNLDEINDAVAMKVGNGPTQLYLFTEPECPYCQRMEQNLDQEKMKGYTLNIMPMPLSFHKEAKPMFNWVLSAETEEEKAERLHVVMLGDKEYKNFKPTAEQLAKFEDTYAKVAKVAKVVGADGTPSVFNDKMEKVDYRILLKN